MFDKLRHLLNKIYSFLLLHLLTIKITYCLNLLYYYQYWNIIRKVGIIKNKKEAIILALNKPKSGCYSIVDEHLKHD